ncbi:MAG: alanyl-tRNA synthetase [Planctomycetota bacterium]|jgi:alanyl-tRNA synthetase
MKTKLLYLDTPDVLQCSAPLLDAGYDDDRKQQYIIVDQTPFYPKGGGQPSDRGYMTILDNDYQIDVVTKESNGEVRHYIQGSGLSGAVGDTVELCIDGSLRQLHSRIHSAGELLVPAMKALGYDHSPAGAIHYVDNASVSFAGEIPEPERSKLMSDLAHKMNEMIAVGYPLEITRTDDLDVVQQICGFVPDYVPDGELIRTVQVWPGYGRPCRGTHVKNISEIGNVVISKIKVKNGVTKISYQVA